MSETVTVTVELDRQPTIEDIQAAIDTLRAEGIPDSFEVDVVSTTERVYEEDVHYADRVERVAFRMSAQRSARTVPSSRHLSATAEFTSAP